MTDEIKEYIDNAIKQALAEVEPPKKDTPKLMARTARKWFRDAQGHSPRSLMGEAFDGEGAVAYAIWNGLRPIVTKICGAQYVRQISIEDEEKVNEIADKLCQTVYDLRKDWKTYKGDSE